ncbi:MAG: (d)CMP kinase [Erysipelotrichaceae bacterium]
MRINIAIDGPSAAGKSTIAKLLAKEFGYAHLDTGAMYRCVAYYSKEKGIAIEDDDAIIALIKQMKISFDSEGKVYINGSDVSNLIRTNEMSMRASKVSAKAKVRELLVAWQREIASPRGYILDGRDIGSVVLVDAEVKFYLVASVEARATRRYKEDLNKFGKANYEEIAKDIEQRDYQDTHREHSPLVKAKDAIEVDTSNMNIEQVNEYLSKIVKDKMKLLEA